MSYPPNILACVAEPNYFESLRKMVFLYSKSTESLSQNT